MQKLSLFFFLLFYVYFANACDYQHKVYSKDKLQLFVKTSLAEVSVGQAFNINACFKDNANNLLKLNAIEFDATMPAHKHGMNYRPKVILESNGIFTVENILLHMPGRWQMQFEFNQADQKQTILLDLNL